MRSAFLPAFLASMAITALGHAAAIDDAKAGWDAFQQRGDEIGAIRLLTQAIDKNELSSKNQSVVYAYRGAVYNYEGRADLAIADFDAAVRLAPEFVTAYTDRAIAWRIKGQYDRAIADYNTALTINPNYVAAYRGRGAVNFYLGRYDAAVSDLQRTLEMQPSYVYAALWLHMARAKQNQPDEKEFAKNVAGIDRKDWPGPLVALFLGEIKPEQLRMAAAAQGTPKQRREQRCEMAFYSAEYELMQRNAGRASQLFREASSICPANFYENTGARVELNRFGG